MQDVGSSELRKKAINSSPPCFGRCSSASGSTNVNFFTSSKALTFDPVTVTTSLRSHSIESKTPPCLVPASEPSSLTCLTSNFPSGVSTPLSSSPPDSKPSPAFFPSLRLPPCSSSDDDMSVNSLDSGFESTSPGNTNTLVDYYDNFKPDDSIDELSKSSSSSSLTFSSERLCLVPPSKPLDSSPPVKAVKKPALVVCKWKDCNRLTSFANNDELHDHISLTHVHDMNNRYCCLWDNCRVYDKPAKNVSWLERHISLHSGKKHFKCVIDGCDASFSSQRGLARHVPSHFSEVGLPKARLTGCGERRYLVKRRRIKDEKKAALANVHDQLDEHLLECIVKSLVELRSSSTSTPSSSTNHQVVCTRRCKDGSTWKLRDGLWTRSHVTTSANHEAQLFFARPTKRARKTKG